MNYKRKYSKYLCFNCVIIYLSIKFSTFYLKISSKYISIYTSNNLKSLFIYFPFLHIEHKKYTNINNFNFQN